MRELRGEDRGANHVPVRLVRAKPERPEVEVVELLEVCEQLFGLVLKRLREER